MSRLVTKLFARALADTTPANAFAVFELRIDVVILMAILALGRFLAVDSTLRFSAMLAAISCRLISTFATIATPILKPIGIVFIVSMPFRAMRLVAANRTNIAGASIVFCLSDRLKMSRIHAPSITTEVI